MKEWYGNDEGICGNDNCGETKMVGNVGEGVMVLRFKTL